MARRFYDGSMFSAIPKSSIAIVGVALLLGLLWWGMSISAHNQETRIRNQFQAQLESNQSSFDKTWKVIQQEAGIAEKERDSFRETYAEIMTAQQGVAGNGSLASFLSQAKVDVDSSLFKKLMTTIEAQRESFHRDQQKLTQIAQNHRDIIQTAPTSWFVGDKDPVVVKLVTSSKTDGAFATGKDDDIELFKD